MIVSSFIYLKLHQIIKLTYQVTDFGIRFQFPRHMYDPLLPFQGSDLKGNTIP